MDYKKEASSQSSYKALGPILVERWLVGLGFVGLGFVGCVCFVWVCIEICMKRGN